MTTLQAHLIQDPNLSSPTAHLASHGKRPSDHAALTPSLQPQSSPTLGHHGTNTSSGADTGHASRGAGSALQDEDEGLMVRICRSALLDTVTQYVNTTAIPQLRDATEVCTSCKSCYMTLVRAHSPALDQARCCTKVYQS